MTEPGSQLLAAVRIMDRLRSPGGGPWGAEQTHLSLAPYRMEEAYETLDAIETGDLAGLREELGDLLLQVLFHARLAEEAAGDDRFGIDQVAADLVDKLTRRHPHVFAETVADSADAVARNWDEIKKAEKRRQSVTDGVPLGQPALALAAKLVSRSRRAGLSIELPPAAQPGAEIGDALLALVGEAVRAGIDPEQALRERVRRYAEQIRVAEAAHPNAVEAVVESSPLEPSMPQRPRADDQLTDKRAGAPLAGGEKATLVGFLDYQRQTLLLKCAGLSAEQLVTPACPPSTLRLLGLLRHLIDNEYGWFCEVFAGEPEVLLFGDNDADLLIDQADDELVAATFAQYAEQVGRSRQIIEAAELGQPSVRRSGENEPFSLRWIIVHLIEEYARHNGHADLLRQALDGAVGE
ncbi:MAG: DUF664 domain-containing protein [Jatrophihabitans sp.]